MLGCYLAPRDASTLGSAVAAIGHRLRCVELLISAYLNTDLELPDRNEHDEAIASAMEKAVLDYMREHFLP